MVINVQVCLRIGGASYVCALVALFKGSATIRAYRKRRVARCERIVTSH